MNGEQETRESAQKGHGKPPGRFRDALGITVFALSAGSIVVLGMVLIFSAEHFNQKEKVFSAILPLLGTWVGTILAFYFSRENFEAARQSLENVVERLTPEQRLQQTPVTEAMTPLAQIRGIPLSPGNDDASVKVADLLKIIDEGFTRLPVFNDNKSGRYVIHQSVLYRYIAQGRIEDPDFDHKTKTLKDMVDKKEIAEQITSIAWVRSDATLAEAKRKIEELKQCQDAFVTESGQASDPVIGWVTNIDIQKRSRA